MMKFLLNFINCNKQWYNRIKGMFNKKVKKKKKIGNVLFTLLT